MAFSSNYPYWYLGSTPFKFLTGPIIPVLSVLVGKLIPSATYIDILIFFVIVSCIISAAGWSVLISKINGEKINFSSFMIYFLIFAVLPYKYLSGLALAEPSAFIAEMLIPFVLLTIRRNSYWGSLAIAALLLISTNVLPVLLSGVVILSLTASRVDGKIRKWKKPLEKSLIIFGIGFILATFYYTPAFWLIILINPSIGGVPGISAILSLLGLARNMIPVFLAFIAVYFSKKIQSRLTFFGWVYLLVFGFLTLWRIFGNINFWMDWTSWLTEIEIGVGILIAANIKDLKYLFLLIMPFSASFLVFRALGSPLLISKQPPTEMESVNELAKIAGGNLVFTSGTGVFWLNAFYDTPQVGGMKSQLIQNGYLFLML